MSTERVLRRSLEAYSLEVHARGWVANHDGNLSARLSDQGRFLITPTAISKRLVTADNVVLCDDSGAPVSSGRPPSEVKLHVGAYRSRKDVRAVIHAHPPHASAFAMAGRSMGKVAIPEVVVSLGPEIPLLPLSLPKDPAAEALAADGLALADAVLLEGNGVLAVGSDLEQAFLRVELVEHYAKTLILSQSIGGPKALDAASVDKLLELRKKAGLLRTPPKPTKTEPRLGDHIRPIVEEEVRRVLRGAK